MTAEEHDLLASVLANHADDLPRLILADYWDEHGRPDRAEMTRLMCANPSAAVEVEFVGGGWRAAAQTWGRQRFRRQIRSLLDSAALPAMPLGWAFFRRGFVESVTCDAAAWLAHGDAVRAAHPVTRVTLTGDLPFTETVGVPIPDGNGGSQRAFVLTNDPARRPFTIQEVRPLNPSLFRETRHMAPALLRLRWPGVEFELPPERRETELQIEAIPTDDGGFTARYRVNGEELVDADGAPIRHYIPYDSVGAGDVLWFGRGIDPPADR